MSKPQLPSVPESIRERKYKPSGKCSVSSLVAISGIGIPIAALVGAAGPFLGLVLSLASSRGVSAVQGYGILSAVATLFFIVALLVGYLMVIGAAIGWPLWLLARWFKCRNSGWAAGIGSFEGVVAFAMFVYSTGELTAMGAQMNPLVLIGSFIVLVGAAALVPSIQIENTPFCETCNEWYADWKKGRFSLDIAELMLRTLESRSVQTFGNTAVTAERPCLELKLERCPHCGTSDIRIATSVVWTEITKDAQGKEVSVEKKEDWFKAVVSAELGVQMEKILFG